jgi:hypothetical protein
MLIVGGIVFLFGVVVWLSTGIEAAEKVYEIRPYVDVGVPEYRSDAARAIDAYEQMMDRYMSMTERELYNVGANVVTVSRQLDAIDAKVNRLHARLGRIEKKLGIAGEPQVSESRQGDERRRPRREESQRGELDLE